MSTQSFYLQNIEKGSVGRLDRGVIIKKALWTARRKRMSGPGGRQNKTKTLFPESPPVQPIKELVTNLTNDMNITSAACF